MISNFDPSLSSFRVNNIIYFMFFFLFCTYKNTGNSQDPEKNIQNFSQNCSLRLEVFRPLSRLHIIAQLALVWQNPQKTIAVLICHQFPVVNITVRHCSCTIGQSEFQCTSCTLSNCIRNMHPSMLQHFAHHRPQSASAL